MPEHGKEEEDATLVTDLIAAPTRADEEMEQEPLPLGEGNTNSDSVPEIAAPRIEDEEMEQAFEAADMTTETLPLGDGQLMGQGFVDLPESKEARVLGGDLEDSSHGDRMEEDPSALVPNRGSESDENLVLNELDNWMAFWSDEERLESLFQKIKAHGPDAAREEEAPAIPIREETERVPQMINLKEVTANWDDEGHVIFTEEQLQRLKAAFAALPPDFDARREEEDRELEEEEESGSSEESEEEESAEEEDTDRSTSSEDSLLFSAEVNSEDLEPVADAMLESLSYESPLLVALMDNDGFTRTFFFFDIIIQTSDAAPANTAVIFITLTTVTITVDNNSITAAITINPTNRVTITTIDDTTTITINTITD